MASAARRARARECTFQVCQPVEQEVRPIRPARVRRRHEHEEERAVVRNRDDSGRRDTRGDAITHNQQMLGSDHRSSDRLRQSGAWPPRLQCAKSPKALGGLAKSRPSPCLSLLLTLSLLGCTGVDCGLPMSRSHGRRVKHLDRRGARRDRPVPRGLASPDSVV